MHPESEPIERTEPRHFPEQRRPVRPGLDHRGVGGVAFLLQQHGRDDWVDAELGVRHQRQLLQALGVVYQPHVRLHVFGAVGGVFGHVALLQGGPANPVDENHRDLLLRQLDVAAGRVAVDFQRHSYQPSHPRLDLEMGVCLDRRRAERVQHLLQVEAISRLGF